MNRGESMNEILNGEEYMYEVKVDYENYKILVVDESKRVGLEYLGSRLVNCWYVSKEVMLKEIKKLCSNGYENIDYDVSIDEVVLGKYDKKDIKMLWCIDVDDFIVYVLSNNVDVDEFIKNNNLLRRV
tara:strand:+ start:315 stop:698 length:384 start_codon:yes stop_codon:yes gene_type:complete